jgi:hypothetical protein
MSYDTTPALLSGCAVLPPLEPTEAPAPSPPAKPNRAKGTPGPGNRFAVTNAFADFTLAGLSRAEIAAWLLLWRDTKADGTARTSQADLARRAGSDVRTVRRALRQLQAAGLLVVVRRGSLARGASLYRVRGQPKEG